MIEKRFGVINVVIKEQNRGKLGKLVSFTVAAFLRGNRSGNSRRGSGYYLQDNAGTG